MAIPQKIKKLTELALKDKVLTEVERDTIVKAALEAGVTQREIDSYIQQATDKRLHSIYSKDEMTHCPFCGGLAPLISDICPHCYRNLHDAIQKQQTPAPDVKGTEADIINRENALTAQQHRNPKTCPNCGAPFPLMSNVCGYCQYVLKETQADSDYNLKKIIFKIAKSTDTLSTYSEVSISEVLKFRMPIILFFMGGLLTLISFSFESLCTCILAFPCIIMAFIILFRRDDDDSPAAYADNKFYEALYKQEKYSRILTTLYGDNPEAVAVLEKYKARIEQLKQERKKNRNMIVYILLGLTALSFSLPMLVKDKPTKFKEDMAERQETYDILMDTRKIIAPNQYRSVSVNYMDYIQTDQNAVLSIDVQNESSFDRNILDDGDIWYKLQLNGVKIVSTGKKTSQPDTVALRVLLWDKNNNRVGKKYYPIKFNDIEQIINNEDDKNEMSRNDNLRSLLEKGEGSYYANFISNDSTMDIYEIKSVIDSVYSFTIF